MNFRELHQAKAPYDELMVIEKNIEKQGRIYHIAGQDAGHRQFYIFWSRRMT